MMISPQQWLQQGRVSWEDLPLRFFLLNINVDDSDDNDDEQCDDVGGGNDNGDEKDLQQQLPPRADNVLEHPGS